MATTGEMPKQWHHDLLTHEEECDLARRAQAGDTAARDELILKNQRLAVAIARRKQNGYHELLDLIQVGNRGLMVAAERFDPEREIRFSTYAVRWIKHFVQREIDGFRRVIAIPDHSARDARRLKMKATENRGASFEEVADLQGFKGLARKRVRDTLAVIDAEFQCVYECTLPGDADHDTHEQREYAAWLLRMVPPLQAKLLRHYYGLDGEKAMTFQQIADTYGGDRQRTQEVHQHAIARLRKVVKAEDRRNR